MSARLRVATFNLEDFGETVLNPAALERRIAVLRPILLRLDADVLCLQEVNGQGHGARDLSALDRLVASTPYAGFQRIVTTGPIGDGPMDKHNLVVLSRLPVSTSRQVRHALVPPLTYRPVTALPTAADSVEIPFDRPFLHVVIALGRGRQLHVVNLHLKAPIAVPIAGQKLSPAVWRTVSGWAEGYLLGALKRAGQALEVRLLIDQILDAEPDALIAICGDFNCELHEVPVRLCLGQEIDTGNPTLEKRALAALDRRLPESERYSVVFAGRRVMPDHILVSSPLLAAYSGGTILNDALEDEAARSESAEGVAGSFHAPIVSEFAL